MLEVQIQLNVRPGKMDDVMALLYEDKTKSMASNDVFSEFNFTSNKNKIEIRARCHSMEKLSEHMVQTHYRWKDLKQNGTIISQTHRFITL